MNEFWVYLRSSFFGIHNVASWFIIFVFILRFCRLVVLKVNWGNTFRNKWLRTEESSWQHELGQESCPESQHHLKFHMLKLREAHTGLTDRISRHVCPRSRVRGSVTSAPPCETDAAIPSRLSWRSCGVETFPLPLWASQSPSDPWGHWGKLSWELEPCQICSMKKNWWTPHKEKGVIPDLAVPFKLAVWEKWWARCVWVCSGWWRDAGCDVSVTRWRFRGQRTSNMGRLTPMTESIPTPDRLWISSLHLCWRAKRPLTELKLESHKWALWIRVGTQSEWDSTAHPVTVTPLSSPVSDNAQCWWRHPWLSLYCPTLGAQGHSCFI